MPSFFFTEDIDTSPGKEQLGPFLSFSPVLVEKGLTQRFSSGVFQFLKREINNKTFVSTGR